MCVRGIFMSENKFELIIENSVVTEYKGECKIVEIPEGITEIGANAFKNCDFIEEINIKSTILKTIGESAFEGCTNMKNCTLSSLKGSVEDRAFSNCKALNYIEIPDGTIKIGKDVFASCKSLLYVAIPSTVFVVEGKMFDNDNKKTVILGELGSEAEEYAKANKMPFKENTPAIRNTFVALCNKKDNTGYKDFNILGEKIRCYKSLVTYENIITFFKVLSLDFMDDVFKNMPKSISKFSNNLECLGELHLVYMDKTKKLLEKQGIFVNEDDFEIAMDKYIANYLNVCTVFGDACIELAKTVIQENENLKNNLLNEAESKVTGLGYGVIGDTFDLLLHSLDEYAAERKQRKEAYKVAGLKMEEGSNRIQVQAQATFNNLVDDTIIPGLEKSVDYFVSGLLDYVIKQTVKAKVIDSRVINAYDFVKSNKIIEQAQKNDNVDRKYAIATALKLYPLNVNAVVLAINENLVDEVFLRLVDYLDIYKNYDVVLAFEDNFSYIEFISFVDKNKDVLSDGFKAKLQARIEHKANKLIEKINNDGDPMEIDIDTWNDLVQKYTIIDSKNIKRYKISEDEVKGPNGRELLSKAIAVARDEKHKADLVKKKDDEKKQEKIKQKAAIKEIENQIIEAEEEIEKSKGVGHILFSAFLALVFFVMSVVCVWGVIDYQMDIEEISTVFVVLFVVIMFFVMSYVTRNSLKEYRQDKAKAKELRKQIKEWEKNIHLLNDNFESEHKVRVETEKLKKEKRIAEEQKPQNAEDTVDNHTHQNAMTSAPRKKDVNTFTQDELDKILTRFFEGEDLTAEELAAIGEA